VTASPELARVAPGLLYPGTLVADEGQLQLLQLEEEEEDEETELLLCIGAFESNGYVINLSRLV